MDDPLITNRIFVQYCNVCYIYILSHQDKPIKPCLAELETAQYDDTTEPDVLLLSARIEKPKCCSAAWLMTMQLDQDPVIFENSGSRTPFLLVCEHAGRAIPADLRGLGVSPEVVNEHFGWDIGALAVAQGIAQQMDAELVYQQYSRLLIDCNRPLTSKELIPEVSERVVVPGNVDLPKSSRAERINRIWQPFQQAIGEALDRRVAHSGGAILMAVHSFSPVFLDEARPWQVCLAYNRDDRMARLLFTELTVSLPDYQVAMNQPFYVSDDDDQTIPAFGERRNIPHVLLEIRNDLLRSTRSQQQWAGHIASALQRCREQLIGLC
jgi:predicted N-formylglutamate amidohydrolase